MPPLETNYFSALMPAGTSVASTPTRMPTSPTSSTGSTSSQRRRLQPAVTYSYVIGSSNMTNKGTGGTAASPSSAAPTSPKSPKSPNSSGKSSGNGQSTRSTSNNNRATFRGRKKAYYSLHSFDDDDEHHVDEGMFLPSVDEEPVSGQQPHLQQLRQQQPRTTTSTPPKGMLAMRTPHFAASSVASYPPHAQRFPKMPQTAAFQQDTTAWPENEAAAYFSNTSAPLIPSVHYRTTTSSFTKHSGSRRSTGSSANGKVRSSSSYNFSVASSEGESNMSNYGIESLDSYDDLQSFSSLRLAKDQDKPSKKRLGTWKKSKEKQKQQTKLEPPPAIPSAPPSLLASFWDQLAIPLRATNENTAKKGSPNLSGRVEILSSPFSSPSRDKSTLSPPKSKHKARVPAMYSTSKGDKSPLSSPSRAGSSTSGSSTGWDSYPLQRKDAKKRKEAYFQYHKSNGNTVTQGPCPTNDKENPGRGLSTQGWTPMSPSKVSSVHGQHRGAAGAKSSDSISKDWYSTSTPARDTISTATSPDSSPPTVAADWWHTVMGAPSVSKALRQHKASMGYGGGDVTDEEVTDEEDDYFYSYGHQGCLPLSREPASVQNDTISIDFKYEVPEALEEEREDPTGEVMPQNPNPVAPDGNSDPLMVALKVVRLKRELMKLKSSSTGSTKKAGSPPRPPKPSRTKQTRQDAEESGSGSEDEQYLAKWGSEIAPRPPAAKERTKAAGSKRVQFTYPLVSEVHERPYTDPNDLRTLFFVEGELEELEWDRATVEADQFEVSLLEEAPEQPNRWWSSGNSNSIRQADHVQVEHCSRKLHNLNRDGVLPHSLSDLSFY